MIRATILRNSILISEIFGQLLEELFLLKAQKTLRIKFSGASLNIIFKRLLYDNEPQKKKRKIDRKSKTFSNKKNIDRNN